MAINISPTIPGGRPTTADHPRTKPHGRSFPLVGLALALLGCGGTDESRDEPFGGDIPLTVRKDVAQLTNEEKIQLIDAFKAMKEVPSQYDESSNAYDYFVQLHVDAFTAHGNNHPHGSPHFLPWHREFLHRFESEMRRAYKEKHNRDEPLAIPYWNWTNPGSKDMVFNDSFLGGDGDPSDKYIVKTGPFREGEWEISVTDLSADENDPPDEPQSSAECTERVSDRGLVRCLGFEVPLPTQKEVDEALSIPTYDVDPYDQASENSFRNSIEGWRPYGLHNQVHVYVSGQMGTAASPNDPVFYVHHANIDRLWVEWQKQHGDASFPAAYADGQYSTLYVFGTKANTVFDLEAMGIRYADP